MNLDLKGTASCYMFKAVHGNSYEELRAVFQGKVAEEILQDGCLVKITLVCTIWCCRSGPGKEPR